MKKTQLEFSILKEKENDRHFQFGGRSFYFFDFDDNIAQLMTPLILFHKETGEEIYLSSQEWAIVHTQIGCRGIYKDFEIRFSDHSGTFKYFRDHEISELEKLGHKEQVFVQDVAQILKLSDLEWKGPSWECFYHACFNHRPISIITARGHHPDTIKKGIRQFIFSGWLPHEPNYLTIFPVSNVEIRKKLGDESLVKSTAELKQLAIRRSVESAFTVYGQNDHHRFGMSDDDPKNLKLIVDEMAQLKKLYPKNGFFVIETFGGKFKKTEITLESYFSQEKNQIDGLASEQLSLIEIDDGLNSIF